MPPILLSKVTTQLPTCCFAVAVNVVKHGLRELKMNYIMKFFIFFVIFMKGFSETVTLLMGMAPSYLVGKRGNYDFLLTLNGNFALTIYFFFQIFYSFQHNGTLEINYIKGLSAAIRIALQNLNKPVSNLVSAKQSLNLKMSQIQFSRKKFPQCPQWERPLVRATNSSILSSSGDLTKCMQLSCTFPCTHTHKHVQEELKEAAKTHIEMQHVISYHRRKCRCFLWLLPIKTLERIPEAMHCMIFLICLIPQ